MIMPFHRLFKAFYACQELERDRVGVISGEGMGDGTVAVVVDSSLRMVNSFTQAVLMSLGVCPEDVRSFAPSFQMCELCCVMR